VIPVAVNSQAVGFATCPAGMVVTGGGTFNDSAPTNTAVQVSASDWTSSTVGGPPDTWFAVVNNTSGTTAANFVVEAICTHPTSVSLSAASKAAKALRAAQK
jgi:hypothetical protein